MDDRLIPINGVIALLRGEGGWPRLLGDQGFRRDKLEVPLQTSLGPVRVDAVLYRKQPDLILLVEAKSGKNIDRKQATRYLSANAEWLRRVGALPAPLRRNPAVPVRTMFAGLEKHRAQLERALREFEIDAPLLTVGASRARLTGASCVPGLDDFDMQHKAGLPPARLPIDHQSQDDELRELVIPELIAAQAQDEDVVAVESLAARILPEWAVLSHSARRSFANRVSQLVRHLATHGMRGQFRYEPETRADMTGRIIIERTPATDDPRGRTRAWQAQQNRAGAALRRQRRHPTPGQLSLDDLAEAGGLADD